MNSRMNPVLLIRKKRNGEKLTHAEIDYLIRGYKDGEIPDYQFAAFLMAVYFQGFDFEETKDFMEAMLHSGKVFNLKDINKPKIDKHSTGGVGDKVSLVLAPLVASCGICVPMISGRGLGHTGGTLDKLSAIPGFRTDLGIRQFKRQLKKIGIAMAGQTPELAPADRKIYALRDVTATVESIPLIAASIISKKLAEDLDGLVLDVKIGSGAFMQEFKRAKKLARLMIYLGNQAGTRVIAVLSDMDNPLGDYIGNSLEVIEAIEALKGRGPDDLMELTYTLGTQMLKLAGIKKGKRFLKEKIKSGSALKKFQELIQYQGGDIRIIDDYTHLPRGRYQIKFRADNSGYIKKIDNFQLGMLLTKLGGGRIHKEDAIDPGCGFQVFKKIGDFVKKGECLVKIITDEKTKALIIKKELRQIFSISNRPCRHKRLVRAVVR